MSLYQIFKIANNAEMVAYKANPFLSSSSSGSAGSGVGGTFELGFSDTYIY